MTLLKHELKRGRLSLIIWSAAISLLLIVCVLIFPLMKASMDELNQVLGSMGSYSEVLGMDQLDFTDCLQYFSMECSEMLGLGGGLFAALAGIAALAGEEKERTAEFLMTHPVSRQRIVAEKLAALMIRIFVFDVAVTLLTGASILLIGEEIHVGKYLVLMGTYLILHLELALISFGLSAFIRKGGVPIALGAVMGFYFLSIVSNIAEEAEFLQYLTPFGYANGTYLLEHLHPEPIALSVGIALAAASVLAAFLRYRTKEFIC